MADAAIKKKPRPKNLDLSTIRLPLPGFVSILHRISGAVMLVVGLYVAWYGWFELRLFGSGETVDDPVIAAARRVQGALAGWVYSHGAWPWLIAFGAVAAAAAWGWARRRRSAQQGQARLESRI